jgi:hypothetical protein
VDIAVLSTDISGGEEAGRWGDAQASAGTRRERGRPRSGVAPRSQLARQGGADAQAQGGQHQTSSAYPRRLAAAAATVAIIAIVDAVITAERAARQPQKRAA